MRIIDADALKMEFPRDEDWDYPVNTNSFVCELIDKQPTIELERKKGKWIRWYEEIKSDSCTDYIPHCKCSECGTDINTRSSLFIKFCPYCGADMRGES